MAMNIGQESGEDDVLSAINTTPLVDVMLVLLIIFLITIPVVTHTVPVRLPKETVTPLQTRPDSIEIAVDRNGAIFWNEKRIELPALTAQLQAASQRQPQPEVHVRGDQRTHYEYVGRVVTACERVGITKVSFITQPPARGQ
ncbi:biopolymer transporter ExbD [Paraburkholderia xenovorans]|uniref:ExbD/TolR family protein n=1 Tax=Paraburkholderia xenovorans TaxID=36873 RepID=UPI0038BB246E